MKTYIGIDAAWTENKHSGIAKILLDDNNNLFLFLDCADNYNDLKNKIFSLIKQHDYIIIGFDAPLIRTNQPASEGIDAKISRLYGKFRISAHTARLHMPRISDNGKVTKTFMLAKGLNININPLSNNPKKLVEVYPH